MADGPDEELFAGVAVEAAAAAVGGFCALEADALMSTGQVEVGVGERVAGGCECGLRSQSLGEDCWRRVARGLAGESQIRRGAGWRAAIKSRRQGGATRVQRGEDSVRACVCRVGRKKKGRLLGKRATQEAVRALSLACSEKSRDRCSSGEFQQTRL